MIEHLIYIYRKQLALQSIRSYEEQQKKEVGTSDDSSGEQVAAVSTVGPPSIKGKPIEFTIIILNKN